MKTIAVAIIHGIGINNGNFADDLIKEVRTEFNNRVELKLGRHEDYFKYIQFQPIPWDTLLGPRQKELAAKIRANMIQFTKPVEGNFWQKMAGSMGAWLNHTLRADFAAEFIMDIISYGDQTTRQSIQKYIEAGINKITPAPLSIIAHSLGTVIAADYVRDNKIKISNFFTMGSPIQLFSLEYGQNVFKSPIRCEAGGRWINIFDQDDPIAYRLQDISEDYKRAIHLKDCEVDCGVYGQAHVGYWNDKNVQRIVGSKLALDWLRLNDIISEEEFNKGLMAFDKDLHVF